MILSLATGVAGFGLSDSGADWISVTRGLPAMSWGTLCSSAMWLSGGRPAQALWRWMDHHVLQGVVTPIGAVFSRPKTARDRMLNCR